MSASTRIENATLQLERDVAAIAVFRNGDEDTDMLTAAGDPVPSLRKTVAYMLSEIPKVAKGPKGDPGPGYDDLPLVEEINSINLKIGDLSQLPLHDKSSLVGALSELLFTVTQIYGDVLEHAAPIDDAAGVGDINATWSADKSSRELTDKVDKITGLGLSELSFTTDDKNSLEQSEQDRHTHANTSVIDDLSDNAGALEYRGLPVSDQAALDAKVDKVAGYSLVADDEIDKLTTVEQDAQKNTISSVAGRQGDVELDKSDVGLGAVDNTADADKPVSTAVAVALLTKFDKADVVQATGQSTESVMSQKAVTDLVGDVESVLVAINGEP